MYVEFLNTPSEYYDMQCIECRTLEFQRICNRVGVRPRQASATVTHNVDALSEAMTCIQKSLLRLHGKLTEMEEALENLHDEVSVDKIRQKADEMHAFIENPNRMKEILPKSATDVDMCYTLLLAVIAKQTIVHEKSVSALPTRLRTWISHHRCIFKHLAGMVMSLRKQRMKPPQKEQAQKRPEHLPAVGLNVMKNTFKTIVCTVAQTVTEQLNAETLLAPANYAAVVEENTTDTGQKALVNNVMQISELNSFVEHLVFEQNDSVDQIVQNTQHNIESITEANDILVREKKAKMQMRALTYQRFRIVALFIASIVLLVLHTMLK